MKIVDNGTSYNNRLTYEDENDFKFLNDSYILSKNKICEIHPVGENFSNNEMFNIEFEYDYIESFLSLLFSYYYNIKVSFGDYEIKNGNNKNIKPSVVFEKVDSDKSLYINLTYSYKSYNFNFFDDFNIERVVFLNKMDESITVHQVDYYEADEKHEQLKKLISKYSRKNSEYSAYLDDNLIIIPGELAGEFLTHELSYLLENFEIYGTDKLSDYKLKVIKPKISFSVSHSIDFLDSEDVLLDIGDEQINIFDAIESYKKNSYIKLSDGTNAIISKKYMNKLQRIFKKKKDNVNISFFDMPIIEELIDEKVKSELFPKTREIFLGFNSIGKMKVKLKIDATLREYQEYGVKWLKYLYDNKLGGCLADDMGLGKTLQAIGLLSLIYPKSKKKTLIVMPKSLIYNWENEIKKFNKSLNYKIHYGVNRDFSEAMKNDIILTTYGTVRNDIEKFREIEFDTIILDESQQIKNINTKVTKAIMLLKSDRRFALSGTPIENNLGELFSLFRFLNPAMFLSAADFKKNYIDMIQKNEDKEALNELKKKVYPFILRRKKSEVLKELPDKIEQTIYVELGEKQKKLYEERRQFFKGVINKEIDVNGINKSKFFILQALSELRQIASNPEAKSNGKIKSNKREFLSENIVDAVSNRHKVLVFTNYINIVENIEGDLDELGIKYLTMTGATRNRQELVEKFQNDKEYKVFIITLKTGGVGLNLTAADTVFIYDPWWNKSAENQAIDRAHRIGQDKTVFSYRLISKGTIEEKIKVLQDKKSDIVESLVSGESGLGKNLSEDDIEFILGD